MHSLPGRLRLRLGWLRSAPDEGSALAEALARREGMARVTVRPLTGSVLCEYDPSETEEDEILEAVKAETGVATVLAADGPEPRDLPEVDRILADDGPLVAKALARTVHRLSVDLLKATEGRLDLGTLLTLTFAAAGVMQLAR